jgi:hypothetical protein
VPVLRTIRDEHAVAGAVDSDLLIPIDDRLFRCWGDIPVNTRLFAVLR